ncbi:hypothetical protein SteCoe_27686 [Stentor coeruleus]|uniref:Uncharacterized protein n=1 Tax=Stentor coeruleus TaxID=5963 RepID=A0A1R2B9Z7_9CILI|nr:hypothetical protein SteCoe_27686 [Stentor coeruleus]
MYFFMILNISIMLKNYFSKQTGQLNLTKDFLEDINSKVQSSNTKIFDSFQSQNSFTVKLPIIYKEITINNLIPQLKDYLNPADIEVNIRKKKLKDAENMKKDLQEKLSYVSQSIDSLKTLEKITKRPKLHNKTIRQQFFESEKEKTEAISLKMKKFSELQKQTEIFFKSESEKIKKKIEEVKEWELYQLEQEKEKREQRRQEELERLREKKEQRYKQMQELKKAQSESSFKIEKKPLYIKIEENYKNTIMMPELEKRKEELKKRSIYFMPSQLQNIKNHMSWYNSVKGKTKKSIIHKPSNADKSLQLLSVTPNVWALRLMEEEKLEQEARNKKLQERKNLIEKQTKYSELIKEFHAPSLHKSPTATDTTIKSKSKIDQNNLSVDVSPNSKWVPHKYPKNNMVPEPKEPKKPHPINYLEDRRKYRDNHKDVSSDSMLLESIMEKSFQSGGDIIQNLKKVQETTQKIEGIARKKEVCLLPFPTSIGAIEKTASVDNLIISSIKAKIHFLDHLE